MEETIQKFIKTFKSDDFYMYVNNEFYVSLLKKQFILFVKMNSHF